MKTVSCHRKYPITTNFLDTMLEHSVDIEPGESKLDAYRRGLKELDKIAAELRKEANPHLYQESEQKSFTGIPQRTVFHDPAPQTHSIPIISKDKEPEGDTLSFIKLCDTLEELQSYKKMASAPGRKDLYDAYCMKVKDLTATNFTDGLE